MREKDFEWYLHNLNSLYKQYGDTYVAIKNKKVFEVNSSYGECVRKASLVEALGSFIVQRCGADDSAYTNHILSLNFM